MTPATLSEATGFFPDLPMEAYLQIPALGASQLEWLAVSPLNYQYMKSQPREETPALALGTALHMAILEPELFTRRYVMEPNLEEIGGAKPRATNAYKDAVAQLQKSGRIVITGEGMSKVISMRDAIDAHPHAAALLKRCPEREVTALWDRDGRLCRARFDMLGPGISGNIKTTRKLKDFSPWTITRQGYYRAAGWYADGAARLEREIQHHFFLAVENCPPHDVGVFVLDQEMLRIGMDECEALMRRLAQCERDGRWPGMYPDVVPATLTDAIALQMPDAEEE